MRKIRECAVWPIHTLHLTSPGTCCTIESPACEWNTVSILSHPSVPIHLLPIRYKVSICVQRWMHTSVHILTMNILLLLTQTASTIRELKLLEMKVRKLIKRLSISLTAKLIWGAPTTLIVFCWWPLTPRGGDWFMVLGPIGGPEMLMCDIPSTREAICGPPTPWVCAATWPWWLLETVLI